METRFRWSKSVQSVLTHLQQPHSHTPLKFVCPNTIMNLSSLNRILMAHFLKASLKHAQKEQTIANCSNSIIEMHPGYVLSRKRYHVAQQ